MKIRLIRFTVLALAALLPGFQCLAGTPSETARAAVAVARAALEIADERPQLPDSGKARAGSVTSASTTVSQPMRIVMAKTDVISDVLPAQLVVSGWEQGCPACLRQEREIRRVLSPLHWTIGHKSADQIQFVTSPTTEAAPRIRLYQNGVEIKEWLGYQDPAMLSRELRAAWDAAIDRLDNAQIAGSAGEIHASSQIRRAITWWKAQVGDGRRANFHWDRTGAASFPLLAKGDWSAKALFGEAGRMELSAPGALKLPIDAIGFGYRIVGPDFVFDADPVTISGLAARLGPSHSAQTFGVTPAQFVDPLTAWSIVSMLREIWQLLHPTCDLQLGGSVSGSAMLSDEMLAIDFKDCPSIRLVALFTFQLQVKRVEVTESTVRLLFSGSRIVKERTFQVR